MHPHDIGYAAKVQMEERKILGVTITTMYCLVQEMHISYLFRLIPSMIYIHPIQRRNKQSVDADALVLRFSRKRDKIKEIILTGPVAHGVLEYFTSSFANPRRITIHLCIRIGNFRILQVAISTEDVIYFSWRVI